MTRKNPDTSRLTHYVATQLALTSFPVEAAASFCFGLIVIDILQIFHLLVLNPMTPKKRKLDISVVLTRPAFLMQTFSLAQCNPRSKWLLVIGGWQTVQFAQRFSSQELPGGIQCEFEFKMVCIPNSSLQSSFTVQYPAMIVFADNSRGRRDNKKQGGRGIT